jgi:hypothetical protein
LRQGHDSKAGTNFTNKAATISRLLLLLLLQLLGTAAGCPCTHQ